MSTDGLKPNEHQGKKTTPICLPRVRHPRIAERGVCKRIEDREGSKHIGWERFEVRRNYNDSEKGKPLLRL